MAIREAQEEDRQAVIHEQRLGHNAAELLSDYMTRMEVVRELGTTARTFGHWCRLGLGPPSVMLGTRRLFKRSSVRAWLDKKESSKFTPRAGGRRPRKQSTKA